MADPKFKRNIDLAVLVATTKALVAKERVQATLAPFLESCRVSVGADCKWDGELTGKRFHVRFGGAPSYANRRGSQCIGNLRRSDGECEDFSGLTVGGEYTQLFISGRKNQFTIKMELGLRAARRAVEQA